MNNYRFRGALLVVASAGIMWADNNWADNNNEGQPAVPITNLGGLRPHAWVRGRVSPFAKPAAMTVLSPIQIAQAYGINSVSGYGAGAKVAIVDAYDSPNAASDLAAFVSNFGSYFSQFSCPHGTGTFTKVNQSGQASPLPSKNSGWEVEINLDTQWVRAVAPCANIYLVEAKSSSTSDLMTAVKTAMGLAPIVSMSWGGGESSGQTAYDGAGYFGTSGVTFLASSGDSGSVVEWPSSSPHVIGVGGTNLTLNSNGTVVSETGWSGSGGGCSTVEPAIPPQSGFVPSTCKKRATPDVAMNGGSSSPVYVYISDQGGWYAVYGTSLAVQLWAGVVAIADGLRIAPLGAAPTDLYSDAAGAPTSALYLSNYRDIKSGSTNRYSAGSGWDFVTGLGSPLVNSLVPGYLTKQP